MRLTVAGIWVQLYYRAAQAAYSRGFRSYRNKNFSITTPCYYCKVLTFRPPREDFLSGTGLREVAHWTEHTLNHYANIGFVQIGHTEGDLLTIVNSRKSDLYRYYYSYPLWRDRSAAPTIQVPYHRLHLTHSTS